jgi:aerobic carbon-monoxide dehydrogenase medium subunit
MELVEPETLPEALELVADRGADSKVIAGGTALCLLIRQGLLRPAALVSLRRVPGLDAVELDEPGQCVRVGPLVTHAALERHPVLRERLPLLQDVFGRVGNIRVRNVATVGGVLGEADYASDPPGALLALGASVTLAGVDGERRVPLTDFFRGYFETVVRDDELIREIQVPLPPADVMGAYTKFVTRSAEDRPCVGVTVLLGLDEDDRCRDLRVVVGAATELPLRKPEAEEAARGHAVTEELARELGEAYASEARTLSDGRGSATYRREMIRVWVRRTVERARDRALAARAGSNGGA